MRVTMPWWRPESRLRWSGHHQHSELILWVGFASVPRASGLFFTCKLLFLSYKALLNLILHLNSILQTLESHGARF